MPDALTLASAALALSLGGLQAVSLLLARRHLARSSPKPAGPRPPISLIRPVCGRDPKDALTLASSFTQDYPDYELLFCVAVETDPVVPLVRALMADHPAVKARLLVGDDRPSGNPKLNNVAKGWAAAASDWIVMADSNLLLPPDYLSRLQAEFRPGTGMVSSPAVGTEPEGLAARLECAYLNTFQARWQLVADQLGQGYAQGKSLFYRRDLVEAAGGLEVLGRDMAEDVASTKITRAAGLVVRLPPAPFAQPLGQRDWAAVWQRQVRWAKVRRMGFPGLYTLEILNGFLPFGLFAALGGFKPDVILALFLLWYAGEWLLAEAGDWPRGPHDVAMWILRDALAPVLWIKGWIGKSFEWRGNAMHADETVTPGSARTGPKQ
jgi:ceramide glucosyltransferase